MWMQLIDHQSSCYFYFDWLIIAALKLKTLIKTAFFLPLELHFDYHKKPQKYVWDKLINQIIVIFILCTHSPPWQRCTGLRWIKTWWCLEMRRASWSVTGSTPATPPASFPSPGPSSASPAPLTPGALWLWGEKTTQSPVHSAGSRL